MKTILLFLTALFILVNQGLRQNSAVLPDEYEVMPPTPNVKALGRFDAGVMVYSKCSDIVVFCSKAKDGILL